MSDRTVTLLDGFGLYLPTLKRRCRSQVFSGHCFGAGSSSSPRYEHPLALDCKKTRCIRLKSVASRGLNIFLSFLITARNQQTLFRPSLMINFIGLSSFSLRF